MTLGRHSNPNPQVNIVFGLSNNFNYKAQLIHTLLTMQVSKLKNALPYNFEIAPGFSE